MREGIDVANEATSGPRFDNDGLIASLTPPVQGKSHRITYDIAPAAIFKVVGTVAAIWLLIHIFPVIILIALSLMLVATFNPLVRKLQARLGRSWAIVGLVTTLVITFMGALALMIPPLISQGLNVVQRAPQYCRQIETAFAAHHIHIHVQQQVEQLLRGTDSSGPELVAVVFGLAGGVTAFVTVAILTIYLLIEGPQVGLGLMRLLPRKERLLVRELVSQIGIQVGGYMRGQLITSAMAGVFSGVTLWALGVPAALALGALAAIADAVPIVGLLVAVAPAALMALTLSPTKAAIVVAAYLIYHQLESHLFAPRVYGNTLGLSLSAIVISILIGVELMGLMGAVLALPVAAAIPAILAYIQKWHEQHQAPDPESHLP